ncbi:MAG: phosphotransferase [Phycisphaerae bacterium]|nr:phosphotransferase [Phycisphaerae bacterium]
MATKTRLPIWYRDSVCIAHRRMPPMLQMLVPLFPNEDIHLALTSGAPEPAHNRKTSIAVLGGKGNLLAFAKVAGSPLSRRLLEHEADAMAAMGADNETARRAPKLLFAGDVGNRYVTVQSPLHGRPILGRLTDAHVRFLDSLHTSIEKPASETNMVTELCSRLVELNPARPELVAAIDSIMPILERTTVRSTIVHGDFVPWNLRTDGQEISAFDWEYAELDGLPLMDRTHFMIQHRYELDGWTPAQAFEELNDFAESRPQDFDPDQVRAFQMVYLIDHLARLFGERYAEDEHMVHWYRRLLPHYPMPMREAVFA